MKKLTEEQERKARELIMKHSSRAKMFPRKEQAQRDKERQEKEEQIIQDIMKDRGVSREEAMQILASPI